MIFFTAFRQGEKYIPWASLMNLTTLWCGSLNGCFVLATISRASNLFFWLFNSSSTLKNPAQYKTIANAEMVVEKDGKRWFWDDVIFMRNNLN